MSNEQELKPCPFCGCVAERRQAEETDSGGHYVGCSNCRAATALFYGDGADEVRMWNLRTDTELQDEITRLTKENEQLRRELETQNKHARYNNDVYYEEMEAHKQCRQEHDELATLLKTTIDTEIEVAQKRDELAAYAERLRGGIISALKAAEAGSGEAEYLEEYFNEYWTGNLEGALNDLLEESPSTSLTEHDKQLRDEVIELCAQQCAGQQSIFACVTAIRSLKGDNNGKPNTGLQESR